MSPYLGISFHGGSSFEQVDALDDSIVSESGPCFKHRCVELSVFIKLIPVGKETELIHPAGIDNIAGTDPQSAVEQSVVCFHVEGT